MKRPRKSKRIIASSINDTARTADSRPESNLRCLNLAAQNDVYEAIRQGVDDVSHGRTRPAREVFLEMRRKYGIKR